MRNTTARRQQEGLEIFYAQHEPIARPEQERAGLVLKTAINICAENDLTVNETIKYLDNQFECIDFITFDDLDTFYC